MLKTGRRFVVNARQLFTAFTLFRLRGSNLLYFQYVYPSLIMIVIFIRENIGGYTKDVNGGER